MGDTKQLEDFPCLENDLDFDDVRVCALRDGHEGAHEFISADDLMVRLDDSGVQFAVREQTAD